MLTYSINIGTVTESSNLATLDSLLNSLADNSNSGITPKDIRNVAFTLWNNAGLFKSTGISSSNTEYIGFDYQQTGTNLKQKIFLGKRKIDGGDIINDDLLNGDSDILIFNNKPDNLSQDSTKISILSGSVSSLYTSAPYLESKLISEQYIDLNITNQTGNINIVSQDNHVNINGLLFPTQLESAAGTDGHVLKYLNDGTYSYMKLQPLGTVELNNIYSSATVSISGNPVLINGENTKYNNTSPMLIDVGGLLPGTTFENKTALEILNSLLYPNVPATATLTLDGDYNILYNNTNNIYAEYDSITSLTYNYNIVEKSYPITSILSSPGGTNPPAVGNLIGNSVISIPSTNQVFTMSFVDSNSNVVSVTSSLTYIYPYFYAAAPFTIDFNNDPISSLSKEIKPKSDISVNLSGTNVNIYFACPSSYGNITQIIDENLGWNFISSFTKIHSAISITSSSPAWAATYDVYQYTAGGGITDVNSTWTFKH